MRVGIKVEFLRAVSEHVSPGVWHPSRMRAVAQVYRWSFLGCLGTTTVYLLASLRMQPIFGSLARK